MPVLVLEKEKKKGSNKDKDKDKDDVPRPKPAHDSATLAALPQRRGLGNDDDFSSPTSFLARRKRTTRSLHKARLSQKDKEAIEDSSDEETAKKVTVASGSDLGDWFQDW